MGGVHDFQMGCGASLGLGMTLESILQKGVEGLPCHLPLSPRVSLPLEGRLRVTVEFWWNGEWVTGRAQEPAFLSSGTLTLTCTPDTPSSSLRSRVPKAPGRAKGCDVPRTRTSA